MSEECTAETVYIGYDDADDGSYRVSCVLPPGHPGDHHDDWHKTWWQSDAERDRNER
jgi:hypothetical protein